MEIRTEYDASQILKRMHEEAPPGDKVTAIFLFAIKHADDIRDMSMRDIVVDAGLSKSYKAEISKGLKLARHVRVIDP